jgi:hypothetical protein
MIIPARNPTLPHIIEVIYVSASDIEEDFALQTNNAGDLDDDNAEVFGSEHTKEYSTKTYVVQGVLSAQVDTSEKLQRHNLF